MKERTCVSRFVEKSQKAFAEGSSFGDVLAKIPAYRSLIKRVYADRAMSKNFVHNCATSTFGLSFLAMYEFLRHKGIPLPDANLVIHVTLPVKKLSAHILLGEEISLDSRPEQIDKDFKEF